MATQKQVVLIWSGESKDGTKEPVVAQGLKGFNVKQIVCAIGSGGYGFFRAYILTEEGRVFQWGPSSSWKSAPHKNRQISSGSLIEKPVTQIAGGRSHFAAITKDGKLYTWGCGEFGALGHGDIHDSERPKKIEALDGTHIIQVACTVHNTIALSQDGKVFTLGANHPGFNGNGITEGFQLLPLPIDDIPPIKSISGFICHVAAVSHHGHMYTWGMGDGGRLGHADELDHSTPKRIDALAQECIVQVSCGVFHTAVLASDGKVYTFGCGRYGQLGHNNCDNQTTPKQVESFENTVISQMSCGEDQTYFLSDVGELFVCGNGEIGHGVVEDVLVPRKVACFNKYFIDNVHSFGSFTIALAHHKPMQQDDMPISLSLRNIVNSKESSDVVFQTDDGQVFAHKVLLIERSDFFRVMFGSGMRESSDQVVPLSGISKGTLLLVLEYLYTGSVVVPSSTIVDLYMAGEMYGLRRLKQMCQDSLCQCLVVDNAAQLLVDTIEAKAEDLIDLCFQFVVQNFKEVSKTDGMAQVAKNDELMLRVVREAADCHM